MGFFNPAEFAAQCQVPQSQLVDFSEDDDSGRLSASECGAMYSVPANLAFGVRV